MAEGGDEFGYKDPSLDKKLDHDDVGQEVNTTQPFKPSATSSPYQPGDPYHDGEQMEMHTMLHEQSGLPDTSYAETSFMGEETPLLGVQAEQQRSWDSLTSVFPKASAINLETEYSKAGRLQVKMKGFGKKLYDLFTKEKSTGRQQLNPKLSKEIRDSLGPMAQEVIDQENENIRTVRQNLIGAEKQLKEAETLATEREKASQELQELRQRIERTQAKIDALHDEQGSNVESEAELRRQKQLQKNLQKDFENAKKRWPRLKNKQKTRKKNKQRSTDLEQASRQKKVKEIPSKKG